MASSAINPLKIDSMQSLKIKPKTSSLNQDDLKLLIEQIVDFESFEANDCKLKKYFESQGWMNYFNLLNGPTYSTLVKDFWVRAEVYDEFSAQTEERMAIQNNKKLKGKTRAEMGLNEFKCIEIRSAVMGLEVTITQDTLLS